MKRRGELPSNGERKDTKENLYTRKEEKEERETIVIWRKPLTTVEYFVRELFITLRSFLYRIIDYRKSLLISFVSLLCVAVLLNVKGPHQPVIAIAKKKIIWSLYWMGLGVLSSIGLGTGLHTFLLYLGPHIASVTLAAYECGGLNFPEPPYPDSIVCPEKVNPSWTVSIWNIIRKVHLEAFMWGAGTALGELPPYFMARASRLSGHDPDDEEEELKEFEALQKKKENPENLSFVDKAKLMVEALVNKLGFLGILVCASIPNPLFDLAGITCGHFLVPFWTFFGATLIGKAGIKMMLQATFVILAFSEELISRTVSFLRKVPFFGVSLQELLQNMLKSQRAKLHRGSHGTSGTGGNPFATVFEMFVIIMVIYFIISIVNSVAQSYHKRICKAKIKED